MSHIAKVFGFETTRAEDDPDGVRYVKVPDLQKGIKYEEGRERNVHLRTKSTVKGARVGDEQFDLAAGSLGSGASVSQASSSGLIRPPAFAQPLQHARSNNVSLSSGISNCAGETDEQGPESAKFAVQPERGPVSETTLVMDDDGSNCDTGLLRRSASTAAMAPTVPEPAVVPSTPRGAPSSSRRARESDVGSEADAGDVTASSAKKKRSPAETALSDAKALLETTRFEKTWEPHWSTRTKSREFGALCARLRRMAQKVGSFLTEKTCVAVSQDL